MAVGSDALVQARIDKDVKERAARVLAKQGMSVADAIRLLLAHVAEQQKLPFEADVPNAETRAAMQELERGEGKRIASVAALMTDLNADD